MHIEELYANTEGRTWVVSFLLRTEHKAMAISVGQNMMFGEQEDAFWGARMMLFRSDDSRM